MKYCQSCKMNINDSLEHCPLCGAYVEKAGVGYERYAEEIEPCVAYPELNTARESSLNLMRRKSLILCFLAAVAAVVFNVVFTPQSLWSAYVVTGLVMLYTCVLTYIYRKRRFYSQVAICSVVLPSVAFACDIIHSLDTVDNLTSFGYSLAYIVPSMLMLIILVSDVMALTDRSDYKYYLLTMWAVSLASLIPQIVMWIFSVPEKYGLPDFLTLALFIFAIINSAIMTVLHWKKLKKELIRKFFV